MNTRPKRLEQNVRQPHGSVLPYKLLCILLFGRMEWVRRDAYGFVRIGTHEICPYLKTQTGHLKGCLKSLENWGLIRKFHWYGRWIEVELEIPMGMTMFAPEARALPSDELPEYFDLLEAKNEEG